MEEIQAPEFRRTYTQKQVTAALDKAAYVGWPFNWPDAAFAPVTGDGKAAALAAKKGSTAQPGLFDGADIHVADPTPEEVREAQELSDVPDDRPEQVREKETRFHALEDDPDLAMKRLRADTWTALFFWNYAPGAPPPPSPSQLENPRTLSREQHSIVVALARRYRFFHWHFEFPEAFQRGQECGQIGGNPEQPTPSPLQPISGFDCVIGNPPWVSHAGRSVAQLPPPLKRYLLSTCAAFRGFPTTHGAFAELAANLVTMGGRLGLVLPASVSDLEGYRPTRSSVDAVCLVDESLPDFGDGAFEGVVQPCFALVATRDCDGSDPERGGDPWELARPELTTQARELLSLFCGMPYETFIRFGDKGLRIPITAECVELGDAPPGWPSAGLREGGDISEFSTHRPHMWMRSEVIGKALGDFEKVDVLVRQTARYPIASVSDGLPFRNSLLAGYVVGNVPVEAVLCLLNSTVMRWLHYHRYRDARQESMPQVKVNHLCSIPQPPEWNDAIVNSLAQLGARFLNYGGIHSAEERDEMDGLVSQWYGLTQAHATLCREWFASISASQRVPTPQHVGESKRSAVSIYSPSPQLAVHESPTVYAPAPTSSLPPSAVPSPEPVEFVLTPPPATLSAQEVLALVHGDRVTVIGREATVVEAAPQSGKAMLTVAFADGEVKKYLVPLGKVGRG